MARRAIEDNSRMSLRIRNEERAAKDVSSDADGVRLSERDSLRVLDLLESPPVPNARLRAAARALPRRPKN